MIKNVSFDTKEYEHGWSLWINIETDGINQKKLLGSTFKSKREMNKFIKKIGKNKID